MFKYTLFLLLLTIFFIFFCDNDDPTGINEKIVIEDYLNTPLTMLNLGDSYTIGESVSFSERWPNQLHQRLLDSNLVVSEPLIIAKTGWQTIQLMSAIDNYDLDEYYDLVTLLIGVNDQYRGVPFYYYENNFKQLLSTAIQLANNNPDNVIVISIPDYSVTPFGQQLDTAKIKEELTLFNQINLDAATDAGVHYVNITPISQMAEMDLSLLAPDRLHPSGKMYTKWVDLIFPVALDILNDS